jgi:hypothetical protein
MIFVAEYELTWENLEAAMAKRLDWDEVRPETFRFLGEYVWADYDPPFRGVAIFEAESVGDLNNFILHYGSTLKMVTHAASDVVSAITGANAPQRGAAPKPKSSKRRRG